MEAVADQLVESLLQQLASLESCEVIPADERGEALQTLASRVAVLWQEQGRVPNIQEEHHDGHCAFRGFARQFLGDVHLFLEVRHNAFFNLANHRHAFEDLVRNEGKEWESYLKEQQAALEAAETFVFADEPILSALSEFYKCPILLYHHAVPDLRPCFGESFTADPVRLIYWDQLHFDSILLSERSKNLPVIAATYKRQKVNSEEPVESGEHPTFLILELGERDAISLIGHSVQLLSFNVESLGLVLSSAKWLCTVFLSLLDCLSSVKAPKLVCRSILDILWMSAHEASQVMDPSSSHDFPRLMHQVKGKLPWWIDIVFCDRILEDDVVFDCPATVHLTFSLLEAPKLFRKLETVCSGCTGTLTLFELSDHARCRVGSPRAFERSRRNRTNAIFERGSTYRFVLAHSKVILLC